MGVRFRYAQCPLPSAQSHIRLFPQVPGGPIAGVLLAYELAIMSNLLRGD
jgi:hypothetical protein